MGEAKNPETGKPVFFFSGGVFTDDVLRVCMQCASTVAVVYRETKDWRWPAIQFAYMTVLAYAASFIAYHLLI